MEMSAKIATNGAMPLTADVPPPLLFFCREYTCPIELTLTPPSTEQTSLLENLHLANLFLEWRLSQADCIAIARQMRCDGIKHLGAGTGVGVGGRRYPQGLSRISLPPVAGPRPPARSTHVPPRQPHHPTLLLCLKKGEGRGWREGALNERK